MKKTIAIDFDGVIHAFSNGWGDGTIYDEPCEGARAGMLYLRRIFDCKLVVFSARAATPGIIEAIGEWMHKHGIPFDEITNVKPSAALYIDDRALRFESWEQVKREAKQLL